MRIGFIGVGGVAQAHLKNLAKIRGVTITAICDLDKQRALDVATPLEATPYKDYKQMLRHQQLDACYVCVIPGAHARIELDLAERGIPFFVEKPVHLNLAAARKVIELVQAKNLVTCVGYHWRYTKASQAMKKHVAKNRVSLVEGWWYGRMPGVPWWRQLKLSGGQIIEQTTHIVDLARYLAGEVTTVYAQATTGAMADVEHFDIRDASVALLTFASGAVGQITSGCIAEEHGESRVGLSLKGRNWHAYNDGQSALIESQRGKRQVKNAQDWFKQLANGDRAFLNAVKSGNPSKVLSPYPDAAQTLAVTLAANQSIHTGKPVPVPSVL